MYILKNLLLLRVTKDLNKTWLSIIKMSLGEKILTAEQEAVMSRETVVLRKCMLQKILDNKSVFEKVQEFIPVSEAQCTACHGYDTNCETYVAVPDEFKYFTCGWKDLAGYSDCSSCEKLGEQMLECNNVGQDNETGFIPAEAIFIMEKLYKEP